MIPNMEKNETNNTRIDQYHEEHQDHDHDHQEEEEVDEADHDHQEEEEVDEALSLSELPLHDEQLAISHQTTSHSNNSMSSNRRSSSEPQEFFEFFGDVGGSDVDRRSNMCSAEDLIFCGRLFPYGENPPARFVPEPAPVPAPALRRRSESLSELQSSSGGSKAGMIMRISRSLDCQKLRRASNYYSAAGTDARRAELAVSPKKAARPRWPAMLVFGMVKLPPEMELGDIKSRQARRCADAGGNFPVGRSISGKGSGGGGGGASWRLLKALSCKDHASVAVTASLCVPQV